MSWIDPSLVLWARMKKRWSKQRRNSIYERRWCLPEERGRCLCNRLNNRNGCFTDNQRQTLARPGSTIPTYQQSCNHPTCLCFSAPAPSPPSPAVPHCYSWTWSTTMRLLCWVRWKRQSTTTCIPINWYIWERITRNNTYINTYIHIMVYMF